MRRPSSASARRSQVGQTSKQRLDWERRRSVDQTSKKEAVNLKGRVERGEVRVVPPHEAQAVSLTTETYVTSMTMLNQHFADLEVVVQDKVHNGLIDECEQAQSSILSQSGKSFFLQQLEKGVNIVQRSVAESFADLSKQVTTILNEGVRVIQAIENGRRGVLETQMAADAAEAAAKNKHIIGKILGKMRFKVAARCFADWRLYREMQQRDRRVVTNWLNKVTNRDIIRGLDQWKWWVREMQTAEAAVALDGAMGGIGNLEDQNAKLKQQVRRLEVQMQQKDVSTRVQAVWRGRAGSVSLDTWRVVAAG
jgi:hypothetical protein